MLTPHPSGVVVAVWVVPGSSRDEIVGEHDGALKVKTSAPPEGGKANRRTARLIADALGSRHAEVIEGASSRRKGVLVHGLGVASARAALHRVVAGSG